MIEAIPYPRFEKRLPVVLSQTEVDALLRAVKNLKHRTLLTTIYATGLRVSEVTNLLITDIDSSRMIIQVRQGKGRKDRFVMLSPNLLTLLREYWRAYHPRGFFLPVKVLSRLFRGKFVAYLRAANQQGRLTFHGQSKHLGEANHFADLLDKV